MKPIMVEKNSQPRQCAICKFFSGTNPPLKPIISSFNHPVWEILKNRSFFESKSYCACANLTTVHVIQFCMYPFLGKTFFAHAESTSETTAHPKTSERFKAEVQELLRMRESQHYLCYTKIIHI